MLKRAAIVVLCLVTAAATAALPPPDGGTRLGLSLFDTVVRLVSGSDPETRCWETVRNPDGTEYRAFIGSLRCYRFDPLQDYSGIYIDEFEGQRFIAGAQGLPPYHAGNGVWLELDEATRQELVRGLPKAVPRPSRIWQVTFRGRRASDKGSYGHFGSSDGLIVVDRLVSARLLASYSGYLPDALRH